MESEAVHFGDIFTCLSCNRMMATILGQEFSHEDYRAITDKWEIVFKKRGHSLLSMAYDPMLCKKCELIRDAEIELDAHEKVIVKNVTNSLK